MISKTFYSSGNKNAIKHIINEDIYKNTNTNINASHDLVILETMKFVESQVSPEPPRGMKSDEYLYLMNKKVYDIAFPVIQDKIKNTPVSKYVPKSTLDPMSSISTGSNSSKKNSTSINDNIFDPLLLRNFETPTVMDYPKPQDFQTTLEPIASKVKVMEDERSTLIPRIKPIDFSLKTDEKKINSEKMYNELVTNYTPIDSLNNSSSSSSLLEQFSDKSSSNQQLTSIDDIFGPNSGQSLGQNPGQSLGQSPKQNPGQSLGQSPKQNPKTAFNRNDNNIHIPLIENENLINNHLPQNENLKLEFSDYKMKDSERTIVKEPRFELVKNRKVVIVDSADRDLAEYPNQTFFQVKFAPAGNNFLYKTYYDNNNVLIIREKTVVYGDGNGTGSEETFDNIRSIACRNINVPVNNVYIGSKNNKNNNKNGGTPINIFQEPYLYLTISELRGPYHSLNHIAKGAFAKMLVDYGSNVSNNQLINYFTTLKTVDETEAFHYDPVSLGKLDKMSLLLTNKDGVPYNFGIDKLFVKSISEGSPRYSTYCGEKFTTTKITIQNENPLYKKYCELYYKTGNCTYLNNHPVDNSDLLYFYNTLPTNDQIAYLEDNIKITKIKKDKKENKMVLTASYQAADNKTVKVNFRYIIPEVDYSIFYIILYDKTDSTIYYLKILSISDTNITVDYQDIETHMLNNFKIGIGRKNPRGNQNDDNYFMSLFNKSGFYVVNVGDTDETLWDIEINYPYDSLPKYLKDPNYYNAGDIFFIQSKLQISYTFYITYMVKDYNKLDSMLNDSGSN